MQDGTGVKLTPDVAAVVAPVFEHSAGRAASGCDVVVVPVFLSEEAALQVIREELETHGLRMDRKEIRDLEVTIPQRLMRYDEVEGKYVNAINESADTPPTPLVIDLGDSRRQVAVEFVSEEEYEELSGVHSYPILREYDFKEVAGYVSERVRAEGHGVFFGAFYDPAMNLDQFAIWAEHERDRTKKGERYEADRMLQERKIRREAERLLRLQVRDFVDWLKAQGVI